MDLKHYASEYHGCKDINLHQGKSNQTCLFCWHLYNLNVTYNTLAALFAFLHNITDFSSVYN